MELTVHVKFNGIPTTRKVAEIAAKMSAFNAQVLLRKGDMAVNAKSLIGLISLKMADDDGVTIIATGEDAAQAACEMSRLLQS